MVKRDKRAVKFAKRVEENKIDMNCEEQVFYWLKHEALNCNNKKVKVNILKVLTNEKCRVYKCSLKTVKKLVLS